MNHYEWNVCLFGVFFKLNTDEDKQTFAETVMENRNLANMYYRVSESPMLFLNIDNGYL